MAAMSVDELSDKIRTMMTRVSNVSVVGNVGRVSVSSTGHTYFDLHGEKARISCVAWSGSVTSVESGASVVKLRNLDFYAPQGRCQAIVVSVCRTEETHVDERARLTDRLHLEGLLTRSKRVVPDIVSHLCIITSVGSAAHSDMLEEARTRWPGLRTTVIHSKVQGSDAPAELARAFCLASNLDPPPDVIVCGRGGGAETDLVAFDDERVARAFLHPFATTVCAVGHENDHCIADLVADVRAKTPTAAIELAIPCTLSQRRQEVLTRRHCLSHCLEQVLARELVRVSLIRKDFEQRASHSISAFEDRLRCTEAHLQQSISRAADNWSARRESVSLNMRRLMERLLAIEEQTVSSKRQMLAAAAGHAIDFLYAHAARQKLALSQRVADVLAFESAHVSRSRFVLDMHSPRATLKRGYALLTMMGASKCLRSAKEANEGDVLCVQMQDGNLEVEVKRCRPNPS